MKNNIQEIAKKIKISFFSELIILIIIVFTPLYFNYFHASSMELNKIVFFKVLLFFLLLFTVWNFAFNRINIYKEKVFSLLRPLVLFFLTLACSLIFALDFNSAWFGSYDRNEGLISYLFYGLWLLLLIINLNGIFDNFNRLKRILIGVSLSASLVSIYAIFQFLGFDFLTWSEPASVTKRAFSSLGQPNYLATWLLMVMPLSAYLLYISKSLAGRLLYSSLFILQIGALFSTGSRSSFLAFFGVGFLFLLTFFFKEKRFPKKYFLQLVVSGLVTFLIFIAALFIVNPARVNEFKDFKKGSISVRAELWQTGFKGFVKKPFFGYGLENQKEVYVQYYQPDWAIYSRPNTYSDRAHNLILDILLTTGIFGLLAFIYLLWSAFTKLWKSYKEQKNLFSIFLIWSLTTYLFVLLFNFSITVTNIYFFFFLALAYLSSGPIFEKTEEKYKKPGPYLVIGATIIILFCGIISEIKVLEADYFFNKSLIAISQKQYFSALLFNEYLLEAEPNSLIKSYYGRNISLRLIESLTLIEDRSSYYVVDKYLKDFSERISSRDFESRFVQAFILGVTKDRLKSEEIFNELARTSPYLPKIYLAWGDIYLYNNNPQKAILKFEQAKNLLPSLENIYLNKDHQNQLEFYYSLINNRIQQANLMINK